MGDPRLLQKSEPVREFGTPALQELVRYGATVNLAIPLGVIPILWYFGLMDDPRPYFYWLSLLFVVRIAAGRQTVSQE